MGPFYLSSLLTEVSLFILSEVNVSRKNQVAYVYKGKGDLYL